MINFEKERKRIEGYVVAAESKDEHAEVHTPFHVIEMMLDKFDDEFWKDPNTTLLDPCAGIGNFALVACERWMKGLQHRIKDEEERYRNIVENQLFQIDIQPKNVLEIYRLFGGDEYEINVKCCNSLKLDVLNTEPEDWKTERFRTTYGPIADFFEREPDPEEIELLQKTLDLAETEAERSFFLDGYNVSAMASHI